MLLTLAAGVLEIAGDKGHGYEVALRAVQTDPKLVTDIGHGWKQLEFLTPPQSEAPAYAAWAPWSALGQTVVAYRETNPEVHLRYARRSYALSPTGLWGMNLTENLVAAGKRDEARAVAARVHNDGLQVMLASSEARFGKAIALARDSFAKAENTRSGSMKAFYAANWAIMTDIVLGQTPDWVDDLVKRYLDPDPPMMAGAIPAVGAVLACTFAPKPVARRCFDRLRILLPGPFVGIEGLREGAEAFSQGDYAGAAKAWRTSMNEPSWQTTSFRDPMAIAFDKVGETALAEQVDAPYVQYGGEFRGVNLAHVRAARRAEKRGDKETARRLAQQVIDAWSVADEEVPAVADMRKLVARLR
jgi:hypothetical protein